MLTLSLAVPAVDNSKRDLQSLQPAQGAFTSISVAASNLDLAVRSVTGDPATAQALTPAVMSLESALTQAQNNTQGLQPLSISDAIVLQQSVDTLSKSIKIMVMSTMLQRTTLDQLNMTPMILQSFRNQNMLSGGLGQITLSKLPPETLNGAQSAFAGATGSLNMGITTLSNPPLAMPLSPMVPAPPAVPIPAPPPAAPAPAPAVPAPAPAPAPAVPAMSSADAALLAQLLNRRVRRGRQA
ncbi:hypothetical protein C8034_v012158 [Colletotrichum sidae]|uniref:Uncharacterized protein n=1 Tax=Colletotrichum sidae TaxID=1347389 RepID=A0A4R8PR70_9PEZI|nr:hypothetical protein C8034_v012158 [Colletotrichum sidae]